MLSESTVHKVGRIDQAIRDYFAQHQAASEILAKGLMELFIEKGIFAKDEKAGKPIRDILRLLDDAGKLELLKHCKVIRKSANRYWYFKR